MSPQPDGYLGLEGRVGQGPSDALVESGYSIEVDDAEFLHRGLGLADLAHLLELSDAGVVPDNDAGRLGTQLLALLETTASDFPYDPVYGDAYNSRERELERRIGAVTGWLHTGRTRREAGRIAFRVALRRAMLDLHGVASDLTGGLVGRARQHVGTVWNDTTYLQPAQPSTFGHYLAGFAEQATRDLRRIERAFEWVNVSPGGSGGVAGTAIPIDPHRLATSLGFDRPARNARDGMWAVDGLVDVAVASVQAVTTLDRLCEDLEVFTSPQFGYVELSGGASRASVMLPQKKNPYSLSVIRGGAGTLIGRATGLMVTQRTPSARTDNWLYGYGQTYRSVLLATRLLALGSEVVRSLTIDEARLAASAGEHFSVAADLAERIVLDHEVDYRSAYRLVGRAVADAVRTGRTALTSGDLVRAAKVIGVKAPDGLEDALGSVADPGTVALGRDTSGGSAPGRVLAQCKAVAGDLMSARRWAKNQEEGIHDAETALVVEARRRWS
ncbi:MAG: argininosuccinate lyase [bacterium]|nr:argininosuccinate lyase [bacterium]